MMLFVWLNTPSAGLRSGEYGGRKQFGFNLSLNKINNLIHTVDRGIIHDNWSGIDTIKGV